MRAVICLIIVTALVGVAEARETRSLDGQWRFRLDAQRVGINEKWYAAPLGGDTSIRLAGITCLPRQDMANGRIAECELFVDGKRTASAKWSDTSELQTLRFSQPVTTRSLRLVIKSEINGNPFASVAELDVLVQ